MELGLQEYYRGKTVVIRTNVAFTKVVHVQQSTVGMISIHVKIGQ